MEKIKNNRLATLEKGSQILNTDEDFKAAQANDVSMPRNIESSTESFKFKQKDSCDIIHSLDDERNELVTDNLRIHQAKTDNYLIQNRNNAGKQKKRKTET